MKKTLALVLALALVFVLFAACGNNAATTPTDKPTTAPTAETTTAPADEETPAPTEETGPYKYAAGKTVVDEYGFATAPYEYDVPFCTSDEVLTYWTTNWTPQIIDEQGFTSMAYPQMIQEQTGVNVEWILSPADTRREQFSTLLAADDLYDMMGDGTFFYPGTVRNAIDEGYFVNLYDYMAYLPNYTYQIVRFDYDKDMYNYMLYDDTTMAAIYGMIESPMPGMGYCIRGDFLDKLGLKAEELVTYEQVHDALMAIKTAGYCEFPMEISQYGEMSAGVWAAGLDTYLYCSSTALPSARIVDGKVLFTLTDEDDRVALQELVNWYADGLINPGWGGVASTQSIQSRLTNNEDAYCFFNPSEVGTLEKDTTDPNCRWDACKRVRQNAGDVLKIGAKSGHFDFGATIVSAKCTNIELACTWCDWFYSETGSFMASYGPQGVTWDYNEDGEIRLTDFVMNDPYGVGVAWIMVTYGLNGLCDHGLQQHLRGYAYEGGQRLVDMMQTWVEPNYKGEYDWPSSAKFTDEETTEINSLQSDIITYINENWLSFIDGSKPMSEWDSYVQGAYDMNLQGIMDIYQDSYDRYLAG